MINHGFLKPSLSSLHSLSIYFTEKVDAILRELPHFSGTVPKNFPKPLTNSFVFPLIIMQEGNYHLPRLILPFLLGTPSLTSPGRSLPLAFNQNIQIVPIFMKTTPHPPVATLLSLWPTLDPPHFLLNPLHSGFCSCQSTETTLTNFTVEINEDHPPIVSAPFC